MIVEVEVSGFGYSINGEVEIEDSELEGLSEREREDYIYQECYNYVIETIEVSINNTRRD